MLYYKLKKKRKCHTMKCFKCIVIDVRDHTTNRFERLWVKHKVKEMPQILKDVDLSLET